jgi:hypothetical protein
VQCCRGPLGAGQGVVQGLQFGSDGAGRARQEFAEPVVEEASAAGSLMEFAGAAVVAGRLVGAIIAPWPPWATRPPRGSPSRTG